MKRKRKITWNRNLKKAITHVFRDIKYKIEFKRGILSFIRSDGIHCEFYPSDESQDATYVMATYIIDHVQVEIDLYIPDELDELLYFVLKILR